MLKGISRKRKQFLSCGDCGKQFASKIYIVLKFFHAQATTQRSIRFTWKTKILRVVDILFIKTIVFSSGSQSANFLCHGKISHQCLISECFMLSLHD